MINVHKYPASTNQLNWRSTSYKSLTQEAMIDVHSTSTSLASMQGSQLMNTLSTSSSASPTASTKVTEYPDYCAVCTPLGKYCPGKLGLYSDWDEEGDQAKDKNQNQPEASLAICIISTQTMKPYITKYFDNLSNDALIIYTPKKKQRCVTKISQQEHNTIEHKN